MARGNSTWILVILVALLIAFGVYTVWGKRSQSQEDDDLKEEPKADIEYVGRPDSGRHPSGDPAGGDIEIIEAEDEPAFQIGFGMGPGLYGSGRATSEMVGN